MHYVLPQRDLIAASVEAMILAHGFDGMVMLASCDKIIPGMVMAAIRCDLPTVFLTGGVMFPVNAMGMLVPILSVIGLLALIGGTTIVRRRE